MKIYSVGKKHKNCVTVGTEELFLSFDPGVAVVTEGLSFLVVAGVAAVTEQARALLI